MVGTRAGVNSYANGSVRLWCFGLNANTSMLTC